MNENRHSARCTVCNHPEKADIEASYLAYAPVDGIAAEYDLNRDAIYRHVAAFPQLKERRASNLAGLCEWIVEKGQLQDIEITPALFASAITTAAKLRGAFIADRPQASLEQATDAELQFYVVNGRLPTAGELPPETQQ